MLRILILIALTVFPLEYSFSQYYDQASSSGLLKVNYGAIKLLDIDNDDDQDLVLSGNVGQPYTATQIYKNDGNGGFTLNQAGILPHVHFSSVASGDVDSDGDIDLFFTGIWEMSTSRYSVLFLNNGQGDFDDVFGSEFIYLGAGEAEFFDVENDGDLDLFYFGEDENYNDHTVLYINNGSGAFTLSPQNFPPCSAGSLSIGDVDQNGFKDILMSGNLGNGSQTVLFNNVGGTFTVNSTYFDPVSFGTAKLVDFDSDGALDIVVNGTHNTFGTYFSSFYINEQNGTFTSVGNRGVDPIKFGTLINADIDLDGDQDFFQTGRSQSGLDVCAIYLNEDGYFTKFASDFYQGLSNADATFGLINGDCGPDLLYSGWGDACENEIFMYMNSFATSTDCDTVPDPDSISKPTFVVHSNPVSDVIRISASKKIEQMYVFDVRGRLVRYLEPNLENVSLGIADLAAGAYYVRFFTADWSDPLGEKILKIE